MFDSLEKKWKIFAIVSLTIFLLTWLVAMIWYFLFYLEPPYQKNIVQKNTLIENLSVPKVESKKINLNNKVNDNQVVTSSMIIVGDIMLDRDVFAFIKKNNNDFNFPFAKISDVLDQADFRVGNLEGPITTNKSIIKAGDASNNGGSLLFTFSPSTTVPLAQNFDLLSLANNHITNFGNAGVVQTKKYLVDSQINYFGDFYNKEELSYIHTFANDVKVAFVGYHQLYNGGLENVLQEIEKIKTDKSADIIIVYPHWGTEYLTNRPDKRQQELAYKFIDVGADIIIGSHPHVIQPIEIYKGKPIFYSLGNFIFDQYFSPETMQGLMLKLLVIKNENNIKINFEFLPLQISRQTQVSLIDDTIIKNKVLDGIAKNSNVEDEVKEEIRKGDIHFSF